MAEYIEVDYKGRKARQYPDGTIRDERGRALALPPKMKQHIITAENASALQARRTELKREAIARGANAVVAEGGKFDGTDLDFVEAIAEAQAIKALNPDDPKSTDAARFLLQEAGLSDKQAMPTQEHSADAVIAALAAAVGALALGNVSDNNSYRKHDIIEGEARDADSGQAAGDET